MTTTGFYHECTEPGGTTLRNKPDGSCLFLAASRCGVYSDRPLVCRLFPIGLIVGPEGKEKYGSMPLHPDCLGLLGKDGSVESYLDSQECRPFFHFDRLYKGVDQRISKALSGAEKRAQEKESGDRQLSAWAADEDFLPWMDIDATVESYCRMKGLAMPKGLEDLAALQLEAIEDCLASLSGPKSDRRCEPRKTGSGHH
jgi:Fe-S-cluster containining protein